MRKINVHRIMIALGVSLIIILHCGKVQNEQDIQRLIKHNSTHNVNQFIMEKLEENRIVMLADGGHGESLYLQRLISFLDYWLYQIIQREDNKQNIPRDIILIIETDSISINRIKRFGVSGNIVDVFTLGFLSSDKFTTADIEFYFDLGCLTKRIEEYNLSVVKAQKIGFELFGPEKPIDLENWSFQKRDRFSLFERDEYSSDQIIRHLDEHPEAKALIFYGAAHLNKVKTLKHAGDKEVTGFYLAHYLSENIGDVGIYTINQIRPRAWKHYPHISAGPEFTYAFDNVFLRNSILNRDNVYDFTDATLTIIEPQEASRALRWVVSEQMVDLIMKNIRKRMNIENDFYRYSLAAAIQYLLMVSGNEYEIFSQDDQHHAEMLVKQWEAWYDSASIDIVGDIESMNLWRRLLDLMAQSKGKYTGWYEVSIARTISMKPFRDSTISSAMLSEYYEDLLQEKRKQIVLVNLIHLLWVGTDEEKEKAVDILKDETGEGYTTAKQWMVWLRQYIEKSAY